MYKSRTFHLSVAKALVKKYLLGLDEFSDCRIFSNCLTIGHYDSYSPEALNYLLSQFQDSEIDVFSVECRHLPVELARTFSRLRINYLALQELVELNAEAARELIWLPNENTPIRFFRVKEALSESAALELIKPKGRLLFLSLPAMSVAVAKALSLHDHELFIGIDENLSELAAAAIAKHRGYLLRFNLRQEPSLPLLNAFSSNSAKKVSAIKKKFNSNPDGSEGAVYWEVCILDHAFQWYGV
jgi:hypothetical protein